MEKKEDIKILTPGPCPLTISDWMNYLVQLQAIYEHRITHFESQKNSVPIGFTAIGALFAALFIPQYVSEGDPLRVAGVVAIIVFGIIIGTFSLVKFFVKLLDYQILCRENIKDVITAITSGQLTKSDLIRLYFYQKCFEMGVVGEKLIKELKLDQK